MSSWVVWAFVVALFAFLGFVSSHFSVATLRWVAAVTGVFLLVAITTYGLGSDTSSLYGSLQDAFDDGATRVVAALLWPVLSDHSLPVPGRITWIIILVAILVGYRQLEARAYSRQAPVLDITQLSEDQPGLAPAGGSESAVSAASATRAWRDLLVAELKFRLASMEMRSPGILPGGSASDAVTSVSEGVDSTSGTSRADGLAAIADGSGVAGGPLAGAVIRFLGILWPGPRRWQVRFWIEGPPPLASTEDAGGIRITVVVANQRSGVTVAARTVVAHSMDEAACMVAGYVALQVFASDPATPPWCYGASDGRDLGAVLLARKEQRYAENPDAARELLRTQLQILQQEGATGDWCAGVVLYELAQLHDLGRNHLTALRLHAVNREQHPRFLQNRYRLAMSLEMVASPSFTVGDPALIWDLISEALVILHRCGLPVSDKWRPEDVTESVHSSGICRISDRLSLELLAAAHAELLVIRRQLTLPALLWTSLQRRDERTIWRPYLRLRDRQSLRDGVCAAELLVAARIRAINPAHRLPQLTHYRSALRIAAAVAGTIDPILALLGKPAAMRGIAARPRRQPAPQDQARVLPWQRRTASWLAAYNTACLYALLVHLGQASDELVAVSLLRASSSRDTQVRPPNAWINIDPDFAPLRESAPGRFPEFERFMRDRRRQDQLRGLSPARCQPGSRPESTGSPRTDPGRRYRPVPGTRRPGRASQRDNSSRQPRAQVTLPEPGKTGARSARFEVRAGSV
jgi:hypothetical protein